jgi:pimeloyl-ACP methyl ester carboxylesterase
MKHLLRLVLLPVLITSLGILLLAFLGQRRLIYFPDRESLAASLMRARGLGLEPWRAPSGTLLGWRAPHPSSSAAGRLLVFHGNAGSALDRLHFVKAFQSPKVSPALDVYLLEYPGYGPLEGKPSEGSFLAAALAGVDALADKPLLLCGESLGGAVASLAAAQRPVVVRGLILVAPVKNLAEIGRRHYPLLPSFLLRDRFRADRALAVYKGPATFLIAGRDEVVFTDLSLALQAAHAGPHRAWVEPSASHNGLDFDPALPRWAEMAAFACKVF